jgi:hypothetical protein
VRHPLNRAAFVRHNVRTLIATGYGLCFIAVFACGLVLLFAIMGWPRPSELHTWPFWSDLGVLVQILAYGGILYLLWRISRRSSALHRVTALLYAIFATIGFIAVYFFSTMYFGGGV